MFSVCRSIIKHIDLNGYIYVCVCVVCLWLVASQLVQESQHQVAQITTSAWYHNDITHNALTHTLIDSTHYNKGIRWLIWTENKLSTSWIFCFLTISLSHSHTHTASSSYKSIFSLLSVPISIHSHQCKWIRVFHFRRSQSPWTHTRCVCVSPLQFPPQPQKANHNPNQISA